MQSCQSLAPSTWHGAPASGWKGQTSIPHLLPSLDTFCPGKGATLGEGLSCKSCADCTHHRWAPSPSLKVGVYHKPPGALKSTSPYTFKEQLLQVSTGPFPEGTWEGMLLGWATAATTAAGLVISLLLYPFHVPLTLSYHSVAHLVAWSIIWLHVKDDAFWNCVSGDTPALSPSVRMVLD